MHASLLICIKILPNMEKTETISAVIPIPKCFFQVFFFKFYMNKQNSLGYSKNILVVICPIDTLHKWWLRLSWKKSLGLGNSLILLLKLSFEISFCFKFQSTANILVDVWVSPITISEIKRIIHFLSIIIE